MTFPGTCGTLVSSIQHHSPANFLSNILPPLGTYSNGLLCQNVSYSYIYQHAKFHSHLELFGVIVHTHLTNGQTHKQTYRPKIYHKVVRRMRTG